MSTVSALSFAQALVGPQYPNLNSLVNDSDNFTFTTDLKTDALTTAWNDGYVVVPVWDSTITFTPGTWQYSVPVSMTTVHDIYLQRDTSLNPEPIDSTLYEVVAGNIQFLAKAGLVINDNYQLFVKGAYKLTVNDSLTTADMQNYVVNLAGQVLLRKLGFMKVFRFLQNDTTLADIINLRKTIDTDVALYRQALVREFESA